MTGPIPEPIPAPGATPRILVTGSRDWADRRTIEGALFEEWLRLGGHAAGTTLVHGDCPTGADAIAAELWAAHTTLPVEAHPADWSRGRIAGPDRNRAMVALGADVCLAFIGPCTSRRCTRRDLHLSHGAKGCARLAELAGIPTRRFTHGDLQ